MKLESQYNEVVNSTDEETFGNVEAYSIKQNLLDQKFSLLE